MSEPDQKPCGGTVVHDVDGNYVERGACEVHLFDEGVCAWQQVTFDQRRARRQAEREEGPS